MRALIYTITILVSLAVGLTLGMWLGPIGTVVSVPAGVLFGWIGQSVVDKTEA